MKLRDLVRFAADLGTNVGSDHFDLRLIGGLAVHLVAEASRARTEAELGFEVDLLPVTDPRHLAALLRVTDDVDLVLWQSDAMRFERALEQRGLVRVGRIETPPLRYRDREHSVDLIAVDTAEPRGGGPAPSDLELTLVSLDDAFERDPDEVTHLRVATPAALVILKAVARFGRHEDWDLSDIGRLALLDVRAGKTRRALIDLWPSLPDRAQRCLRGLRDDFRGLDALGPSAFIRVVRAVEPEVGSEDVEDDVREQVVAAVQALLDWLDDM